MTRDDALRRLVTIPISHFCEKARWALDRAGLAYVEEAHVQGLHQLAARRAGGGPSVPVLVTDEGVFAQSEWIIRYADAHLPRGAAPVHRPRSSRSAAGSTPGSARTAAG